MYRKKAKFEALTNIKYIYNCINTLHSNVSKKLNILDKLDIPIKNYRNQASVTQVKSRIRSELTSGISTLPKASWRPLCHARLTYANTRERVRQSDCSR